MTVLTPDEAAELLRVSPATVKQWLRAGDLAGWREGGSIGWRTTTDAIDAYTARRMAAGPGRIEGRSRRSVANRRRAS